MLAQLHVDAGEALADRRGDGALEREAVAGDRFERLGRQGRAELLGGGGAGGKLNPVDGDTGGADDLARGIGDFRTDPVAGDEAYRVGHEAVPL